MRLDHILYSQGFGTRKQSAFRVVRGEVSVSGVTVRDPNAEFEPVGLRFSVEGVEWVYHAQAYVMLHKPAGYECSHKPSNWPSVYALLPEPLRNRPMKGAQNGVQAVGRLDHDTTGLLLLSDDGHYIHRTSAPKHHVAKTYEVATSEDVTDAQIASLLAGITLHDDPLPVRAVACTRLHDRGIALTLTQGKYHQVKRMIAAVSNHVSGLHRVQIGGLQLPLDLEAGAWRWLSEAEVASTQSG
jgi:16S rRNA pseudouridine516 synthase